MKKMTSDELADLNEIIYWGCQIVACVGVIIKLNKPEDRGIANAALRDQIGRFLTAINEGAYGGDNG